MVGPTTPRSRAAAFRKWLHRGAYRAERHWDTWRLRARQRQGWLKPIQIMPFLGYGNSSKGILSGRVLEKKYLGSPCEDAPWWENLKATFNRMNSNEIPHARVRARCNGRGFETETDEEGYFVFELAFDETQAGAAGWQAIPLELIEPVVPAQDPVSAMGQILVPAAPMDFVVVSDIDDTIVRTYATDFLRMVRVTFLNNVRTRIPFAGVSAFYEALQKGPAGISQNPIFYVSSSSWNLYDLLLDFLDLHRIPRGPLLLRDWGLDENQFIASGHGHKLEKIEHLLEFYPNTGFILIGDSGQDDPKLYAEAVRRYPGRVLAIYIRDVHPLNRAATLEFARQAQELGTEMLLVTDTEPAARHAAGRGLIRLPEVQQVQQQKQDDTLT